MRFDPLKFSARCSIFLGMALAAASASKSSQALPGNGPACVYSKTCNTGGYNSPNGNTCSVLPGAGPATAGTGMKIYFANGDCATEFDMFGFPTNNGCGDSYASTPC